MSRTDWALKSLCVRHFLQSSNHCFLQPSPSFYRLLEGQGWSWCAWQDAFSHWWKGRCTSAVVTLALQKECTKLIVIALMICVIRITVYFQLTDFNRDNVKQNENVHWRIFLYSGISRYKCLKVKDGYGSSRQPYWKEQATVIKSLKRKKN